MDQKVKNIADIILVPLSLYMAYDKSKADGKLDVNDIPNFITPLLGIPQIIVNSKDLVVTLKSLSANDTVDIAASLKSQFDISDDVLEAKIEAGIEWVLSTAKLVGELT